MVDNYVTVTKMTRLIIIIFEIEINGSHIAWFLKYRKPR
jgi:hypothetical protein